MITLHAKVLMTLLILASGVCFIGIVAPDHHQRKLRIALVVVLAGVFVDAIWWLWSTP